ncbi:hypothetical protein C8255_19490 [filamentous cyanobacterium CCP3]|nr:hypothetical protein C8255_19490 [filamentous cyanobacterium CCP3]
MSPGQCGDIQLSLDLKMAWKKRIGQMLPDCAQRRRLFKVIEPLRLKLREARVLKNASFLYGAYYKMSHMGVYHH